MVTIVDGATCGAGAVGPDGAHVGTEVGVRDAGGSADGAQVGDADGPVG